MVADGLRREKVSEPFSLASRHVEMAPKQSPQDRRRREGGALYGDMALAILHRASAPNRVLSEVKPFRSAGSQWRDHDLDVLRPDLGSEHKQLSAGSSPTARQPDETFLP